MARNLRRRTEHRDPFKISGLLLKTLQMAFQSRNSSDLCRCKVVSDSPTTKSARLHVFPINIRRQHDRSPLPQKRVDSRILFQLISPSFSRFRSTFRPQDELSCFAFYR